MLIKKRYIKYLVKILNDKLEDVNTCKKDCPYNEGCNNLIKEYGMSLCGAIDHTIKNTQK